MSSPLTQRTQAKSVPSDSRAGRIATASRLAPSPTVQTVMAQ